jgi:SagB-type dehydrogenase family enzyme
MFAFSGNIPIDDSAMPRLIEKRQSRYTIEGAGRRREMLVLLAKGWAASGLVWACGTKWASAFPTVWPKEAIMQLPRPAAKGTVTVEQALHQRRTVRSFSSRAIGIHQLSQLLWAAQGVTAIDGFKRAAPSAGALYPMDLYVVIGADGVTDLEEGVYRYEPGAHEVSIVTRGDLREAVAEASLGQRWMARAPLSCLITAEYDRARVKYGQRGRRYAMIEAGHIGQNIFLQAEALGLKAGIVGAFHDRKIAQVTGIPPDHEPLLIMPVGFGHRI